jgi:chemotaxis protein methyltransferase CheR
MGSARSLATLTLPEAPPDELSVESLEIDLMLAGIARRYGYDFREYSPASLKRRIRVAMQKEELPTISALQDRVLHDPAAMLRFVERVAVHTTSMFRDPEMFLALRSEIIPLLRTYPFIRIWHAGCSTGEEVYSLAILLHEEGLYERSRLYATDLSDGVIGRARKRIFPLAAMRDYTLAYQKAGGRENFSSYYTTDHKNAVLRQSLGKNVVFSQHNLVCDGPFNEFHLILCRNVMIYFDPALRSRVHQLLHRSLSSFGFLGVGKKETIRNTPVETSFEQVSPGVGLYRRVR